MKELRKMSHIKIGERLNRTMKSDRILKNIIKTGWNKNKFKRKYNQSNLKNKNHNNQDKDKQY